MCLPAHLAVARADKLIRRIQWGKRLRRLGVLLVGIQRFVPYNGVRVASNKNNQRVERVKCFFVRRGDGRGMRSSRWLTELLECCQNPTHACRRDCESWDDDWAGVKLLRDVVRFYEF